jgi:hypothetical protein
MAVGVVIAVVAVPVLMLRRRQYFITFSQTGVGRDFAGTVFVVDGQSYDQFGVSFRWNAGSHHTFEFKSPIEGNHGKKYAKQYVWASTTGLATNRSDILTVSMSSTVTGNYRPVFKVGTSLPLVMNHRLRSVKSA